MAGDPLAIGLRAHSLKSLCDLGPCGLGLDGLGPYGLEHSGLESHGMILAWETFWLGTLALGILWL